MSPFGPGACYGGAMTKARRRTLLAALAALPCAARAQAAGPEAVIERFHATLLEVMRNAQALGVQGRNQRLRPVMEATFNLPAMTRIAVGPSWTSIPPAEQQALVQAFSDWVIATYANRFDGYGGESFQTLGETPLQNGERLVRTQLNRPNDTPVALSYRMHDFGGAWRVVDVYYQTGSISELASRRAEFTAILREGGPDRLVADLRRRTATLLR